MRLSKFLLLVSSATLFCILYVYQQTEIFRLAYLGQKESAAFQLLLDKNAVLRYNKQKHTSLLCIADKISESPDFQMPEGYRLVRLMPSEGAGINKHKPKPESLLSRLFGIKRQAEAKTIKPSVSQGSDGKQGLTVNH